MKKRILSILLCLVMCLSLLPMVAFAEGEPVKITKVAVTGVPTPVVGASTAISASDVTITTDPADAATINEIYWNTLDETFQADKSYKLIVRFAPKTGYYFEFEDETGVEYYTGDVTFNGQPAFSAYESGSVPGELFATSQPVTPTAAPAPVKITEVAVTGVPTPVVGASTAISASDVTITTDPADAADVVEIYWRNADTGEKDDATFNADNKYFLSVCLAPKDNFCFEFDDTSFKYYTGKATFNDEEAHVAWSYNTDGYLCISSEDMTPTAAPTPVKITEVAVTGVPTPVVGASTAISADDVTITTDPADAATINEIYWNTLDETFQAGKSYRLIVRFAPKTGYYFEFEDETGVEYYTGEVTFDGQPAYSAYESGSVPGELFVTSKPVEVVTAPLPVKITKVEIQVTEPVAGESPDTAAVVVTTPEGAATVFEVPEWYDDDDNAVTVFEEGKDYYCWLSLAPKDGYVFEFEAGTGITDYCGTALVNGEEAIVAESRNGYPTYLYVDQKFTAKAAAPVKITEIVITDADITPVAGEKAGDHLAYTLPTDCHYAATMNGWWDILGSRIMAADDVFEDGGLYCASWNFVADEGYAFAANATITINGSTENVDTEHSYLDTTGDEPLFIISAKGVLVEAQPPAPAYTIIAGMDGEWTKGSMAGLSFTSDAPFAKFDSVQVDGSTIAAANYTAEEGSTKITLAPAYLETLSIGSHSIVVVSTDGTASTNFTVKAAAQPPVPAAYTVTFDMGGHGTAPADQTVDEGGKAERPADPAESGWTFGGWYADAAFSAVFDFDTAINADTIIYAKWTENPAPQPDDPAVPPKTGDSSRMLLWGMLLAAGGAALTGTAAYSRKKKKAD